MASFQRHLERVRAQITEIEVDALTPPERASLRAELGQLMAALGE